jgi:hypothetical protein
MSKKIGFLSFSKTTKNPLLWSHYADRHRGVALELEIDDAIAIPVRYRKTRLPLNISSIMRNGGFTNELSEQLASTKSIHWLYEQEVRVAIHLAECTTEESLFFEQLSHQMKIKGILAGALCKLTSEEVQKSLQVSDKVTLRHYRRAFRSFNIVQNVAERSDLSYYK